MAIFPGSAITPPAGGGAGYTIDQSLRIDKASGAYLNRTPASAGNRKTWTLSLWMKVVPGTTGNWILGAEGGHGASIESNGTFKAWFASGSGSDIQTARVFRDPSAWYHIVLACDTTQATSSDRIKLYVNGVQETNLTATYPSLNEDTNWNNNSEHRLGNYYSGTTYSWDGYFSEVHFIDGQALDPSYFGETDETYGHWKPIEYTGTYGTNGFYLPFSGTFYNDASGNGNNWTANNLATTDVVLDSPTNNFCTWNVLDRYAANSTFAEGNLKANPTASSDWDSFFSTFNVSSGKWYAEIYVDNGNYLIGIAQTSYDGYVGETADSYAYHSNGTKYNNDSGSAYGSSWGTGDVIGIALDMDTGTIVFYLNGVSQGTAFSSLSGEYFIAGSSDGTTWQVANFGQDSSFAGNKTAQNNTDENGYGDFYYSPPSGFLALCTANLSDPAVVPGENFNAVAYAGTSNSGQSITGFGFQPDLIWSKSRSHGYEHVLYDAIRGTGQNALYSDLSQVEGYISSSNLNLTSFDSDGYTAGSTSSTNMLSAPGVTFVTWGWKANNTSGSSNTDGSITSTVAANVDAGFSIVSWTGTGGSGTVGHGLSQAPEFVITKSRTTAEEWFSMHTSLASNLVVKLNSTDAAFNPGTNHFQDTYPTASYFYVNGDFTNKSSDNMIAYCFHSVDGYSKFGSYTGNGSSDGPFVYTGFRPAFVILKNATTGGTDWLVYDDARDPDNEVGLQLYPNRSGAEGGPYAGLDFLSNGFKIRGTQGVTNQSGNTLIYMAFAEFPFSVGGGIAR